MTRLIAGMTMSLDGYVKDAKGGSGGLYEDFEELMESSAMKEALRTTGAVMMGRRTYEQAADPDGYAESYEFRVPLVIVTSHPPAKTPKEGNGVSFIFATQGVADAARRAKEAAKGRDVQCVGGAMLVRSLLREGLVDELQIDVMPVLLGGGLRLFSDDDAHKLRLTSSEHHASGRVSLVYSIA